MSSVDKKLTALEERRDEREWKRQQRIEAQSKADFGTTVQLASSGSGSSSSSRSNSPQKKFDPDFVPSEPKPSTSVRRKKGLIDIVTPSVSSALDRTGISNRTAAFLLAATVDSLGLPIDDFKLSISTIRRARISNRKLKAEEIRKSFKNEDVLTIHWDSKLLPSLTGTETVDRLAIYVSGGGNTKLLGIPPLENGTGLAQANAVTQSLDEWGLTDDVEFMGFDTTSVNTGEFNGSCAILQRNLGRCLINLACRHHIFELVAGAAFGSQFGDTKSPEVALFKKFRSNWNQIDRKTFSAGITEEPIKTLVAHKANFLIKMMTEKVNKSKDHEYRGDYREFLELGIIFLGGIPPRGIHIIAPGAFHHARWMSKVIYSFKIFIFRQQFPLTAEEYTALSNFLVFIVQIYVGVWFRSKNAVAAPRRDLQLLKDLYDYSDINMDISQATVSKFRRHLWYLNEVLIGLSFFDSEISLEMKRNMVAALHQTSTPQIPSRVTVEIENIQSAELHHFITENTLLLFDALRVEVSFFDKDPEDWEDDASYLQGRTKAYELQVVNDVAERGIALIKTFTPIITKHEEQMQYLLQGVEQNRKDLPTSSKAKMSEHYSKPQ